VGWLTIDKAPKDGSMIDLWFRNAGRETNCRWSKHRGDWESIVTVRLATGDHVYSSRPPENDIATHFRFPPPSPR
jgi:hypothetical protein